MATPAPVAFPGGPPSETPPIVIEDGGWNGPPPGPTDRTDFASGSNTAPPAADLFPDFSAPPPSNIVLGGWNGPGPGPPAGTGLVGPSSPSPSEPPDEC
jgi:hypothetical protein